jgi:CheY-like chemotaxis protein
MTGKEDIFKRADPANFLSGAIRTRQVSPGSLRDGAPSVRNREIEGRRVSKRILLVDDEEMVLLVIGEMLRYLGYRVETRKNGKEAFAAFLENPFAFDLIITDYFMPQMRGLELARRVLSLRPEWPVILMSGGDPDMEGEAKAIGIRQFIQKPIALDGLADAVASALGARVGGTATYPVCL